MMGNTTQIQFEEAVRVAMQREIRRTVEAVYEDERARLNKRLDDEKEATLAAMSLHFMRQISVERIGQNITITLRTENIK